MDDLRKRAEKALQDYIIKPEEYSPKAAKKLIHELRVHQVELEMQNDELRTIQRELETSRKKYADLYDFAPVGYCTLEKDGTIWEISLTAADQLGVERDLLLKKRIQDYVIEDDQEIIFLHLRKAFDTYTRQTCELRLLKQDDTSFYAQLESFVVHEEENNAEALTTSHCRTAITDITERKQAEKALRQREETFGALVEHAPDIVARFDKKLRHVYVNPAIEWATGMPSQAFIGKTNQELGMSEELVSYWHKSLLKVFETGQDEVINFDFLTPSGRKYYESHLVPEWTQDGSVETVLGITRDITARKQAEEELSKRLAEREVLLKEVYHRVKNNFHAVSSMLFLQANAADDPHTRKVLQESMNRVRSMASIHERLYQSDNLAEIDFGECLYSIAAELFHTYGAAAAGIRLNAINTDKVFLTADKAIPCAMLINELVSNALKYAFPEGRCGEVRLELH